MPGQNQIQTPEQNRIRTPGHYQNQTPERYRTRKLAPIQNRRPEYSRNQTPAQPIHHQRWTRGLVPELEYWQQRQLAWTQRMDSSGRPPTWEGRLRTPPPLVPGLSVRQQAQEQRPLRPVPPGETTPTPRPALFQTIHRDRPSSPARAE